jgi:hypothetical protein
MAALLLAASTARADPPDRGAALIGGAAVFVVGFAVGGMLVATGDSSDTQANAGWLVMQSTFVATPIVAHGVAGDWVRGLAWAAAPAATTAGSAGLFAYDKGTIFHGSLPEQRWLWGLYGVGLAGATAGLIDVLLEQKRPGIAGIATILPSIAPGRIGIEVQGVL